MILLPEEEQKIIDFLVGELPLEEVKTFDQWLQAKPERQIVFKTMYETYKTVSWSNIYQLLNEENACKKVIQKLHPSYPLKKRWLPYVAILVLSLGLGAFLLLHSKEHSLRYGESFPTSEMQQPILTLPSGQQIYLSEHVTLSHHSEQVSIQLKDSAYLEYIPISDKQQTESIYHTLTLPKECEFSLTLSDGSRVWLNAGSTFKYPEHFTSNRREVFLNGEAYFEVASDSTSPFIVKTENMQLQVLGTQFNISAYPEEAQVITTLLSGKVSQEFSGLDSLFILLPLQQSVYKTDQKEVKVFKADPEETLAWKNGKFIARNRPLQEILTTLSRWYNFKIQYTHPRYKEMRFHLHCPRYENIQKVLNTLQSTQGIRFSYHNGTIYVSQ